MFQEKIQKCFQHHNNPAIGFYRKDQLSINFCENCIRNLQSYDKHLYDDVLSKELAICMNQINNLKNMEQEIIVLNKTIQDALNSRLKEIQLLQNKYKQDQEKLISFQNQLSQNQSLTIDQVTHIQCFQMYDIIKQDCLIIKNLLVNQFKIIHNVCEGNLKIVVSNIVNQVPNSREELFFFEHEIMILQQNQRTYAGFKDIIQNKFEDIAKCFNEIIFYIEEGSLGQFQKGQLDEQIKEYRDCKLYVQQQQEVNIVQQDIYNNIVQLIEFSDNEDDNQNTFYEVNEKIEDN